MPRKGHKSTHGVGDFYDEPKDRTTLILTNTCRLELDRRAETLGISRSELVERFGRNIIGLPEQEKAAQQIEAIRGIVKTWVKTVNPERRTTPRWENVWKLLQELKAVLNSK